MVTIIGMMKEAILTVKSQLQVLRQIVTLQWLLKIANAM